jgi:hypothetical protein
VDDSSDRYEIGANRIVSFFYICDAAAENVYTEVSETKNKNTLGTEFASSGASQV